MVGQAIPRTNYLVKSWPASPLKACYFNLGFGIPQKYVWQACMYDEKVTAS